MTALLLPLKNGANGLNVTEASHVLLCEPILNPGAEAQAIGRIHRIGQTRPTTVRRFLVEDTVEERVLALSRCRSVSMHSAHGGPLMCGGHNHADTITLTDLEALFPELVAAGVVGAPEPAPGPAPHQRPFSGDEEGSREQAVVLCDTHMQDGGGDSGEAAGSGGGEEWWWKEEVGWEGRRVSRERVAVLCMCAAAAQGRLATATRGHHPWVQPWDADQAPVAAATHGQAHASAAAPLSQAHASAAPPHGQAYASVVVSPAAGPDGARVGGSGGSGGGDELVLFHGRPMSVEIVMQLAALERPPPLPTSADPMEEEAQTVLLGEALSEGR